MNRYVIVRWPEIQELMGLDGFTENSHLILDEKGVDEYGSSAYFVNENWLISI